MQLTIRGIEIDCVIGERPDERLRLQRITVDAILEIDGKAAVTDSLEDTVDYVALAERIRLRLVEAKCKMIERAAALVAETALSFPGVVSAEVSVTKSGAVPGIGSATATASQYRIQNEEKRR